MAKEVGDALSGWWGQRDSNPYARSAEDPKSSVSAVSPCPHIAGDAGLEPASEGKPLVRVKAGCLSTWRIPIADLFVWRVIITLL